ncbi:ligand-binding sensor domain-containing protein [Aquiflexum lacus]|uniref:ligand-binding sensor domain-containing protein n=1 Tax=Aquiflexum lacus TaxID=2483805 RepID=UPI0018960757|nr:two-component regulator propeller domain-containing protein [Aquiflexum lacus]
MKSKSSLSLRVILLVLHLNYFGLENSYGQKWEQIEKETIFVQTDWDNSNGLPVNTVFRTVQDKNGFIWMATEEGLVRFDGRTFKIFDHRNTSQIQTATFTDLILSKKGGIYAANSIALVYAEFNDFKVFTNTEDLGTFRFTAITETATGKIFLGTQNGNLILFDGQDFRQINSPENFKIGYIRELIAFEDQILIGGLNGFYSFDMSSGKFSSYELLTNQDVRTIAVSTDRKIYIGTRLHGLYVLENENVKKVELPTNSGFKNITALQHSTIDGGIWIGTSANGIYKILDDQLISFPNIDSSMNEIWDIYEDNQNAIWISGLGIGISRFGKSNVEVIDAKVGLSHSVILTTFQDSEKGIWLGTPGGGLNRVTDDGVMKFSTQNGLSHDLVLSIAQRGDYIYVGTGNGLNKIHLPSLKIEKVYHRQDGILEGVIYSLMKDSKDNIWIGTINGILQKLTPDEELKTIQLESELINAEIIFGMEDSKGVLWFGTYGNGFFSVDEDENIMHFPIHEKAPSQMATGIWEDPEGDLWIGTPDGLLSYTNGKFKIFGKSNGFQFETIYKMIADEDGMLWITGNHGIQAMTISHLMVLKKSDDKDYRISTTLIDKSDGLLNNEFNGGFHPSGWKLDNGKIIFPSMEGAIIVDPQNLKARREVSVPYIETLKYGNNEIDFKKNIEVPPGMTFFNIKYGNIEFEKPLAIKYFYRIRELGNNWIDNDNRNVAYFSGLPPGNYEFQVKSEQFGESSEIASVNFSVKAFFYQTIWFKIIGLISIFVLGYFVKTLITNKRNKLELEGKIKSQTRDLELKNLSLTKALDNVEKHNKLLEDVAWTQSHQFRGPLSKIIGMIRALKNYENYQNVKLDKHEIMEEIEASSLELDRILRELNSKLEKQYEKQ